jgi:hypothetical protein
MTLKLVLGANTLDFDNWANHGIIASTVDLGYPTVREVMTNLPGQDGEFDETAYFGTRVVTITGNIGPCTDGSRSQGLATLAPFLAPKARPKLIFALDTDVFDRALSMRPANFTGPVATGNTVNFSASWKCPDPIAYGLVTNQVSILPSIGGDLGRTYPLVFPRHYPHSYGYMPSVFDTNGDYPAFPLLRIYGPCTDPGVTWLDPVTQALLPTKVLFSGLTINLGDYIEVDTKAQTVLLNGDPNANRYSFLDFANTAWGPLQPGDNLLRFVSSSASSPSLVKVLWQDAFLL